MKNKEDIIKLISLTTERFATEKDSFLRESLNCMLSTLKANIQTSESMLQYLYQDACKRVGHLKDETLFNSYDDQEIRRKSLLTCIERDTYKWLLS